MIGRKIIIQFIANNLISVVSFFTLSLTARFFGPKNLGELNYYLGILGLFLIFSDLGFSRTHIRFVSNKKNISKKVGIFLTIKLLLLVIFLISSFVYFYIRNPLFPRQNIALFILLIYEFFNRLGTSMLYTFEGLQMVALENLILGIGKLGKLLTLILFIYLARNLTGLSISYLVESFFVLILTFWALRRFFPLSANRNTLLSYFYYASPFFIIYPLSYIQGNIDVVLLRNFWTATEVGYYSVALGLTGFIKTINGVLITLFFPQISKIYQKKEKAKIQDYANMATKYQLIIFIPIFLLLHIFRKEIILFILGNQFLPAVNIFSLSLLGIFILMVSSPYDYLFYASGKHKIIAPITIFSTLLLIILELILVPKNILGFNMFALKGVGSALANDIVWLVITIIQLYLAKRILKINFNKKNYLFFIFGTVILSLLIILNIQDQSIFYKVSFGIVMTLIFYFFCIKSSLFTSADKKYLKIVVNPKKILKDSLNEIKKL